MTGAKSTKLFLIAVLLLMISCNKEKKNLPSRFYHNTTSYFNGYYNANELLNTTTAQLEDQYKFPYEGFIEVINYGSEQEISAFNGDLDEIIKKNDVVIFKHPNGNYIDDGRLLNGIAWFYKQNYSLAMQNFDEVIEKFPESDRVPETYLWIAKTFYQMENKTMSEDILEDNFVFGNRVITDKALLADLAVFRSRLALEKEEYADAASILAEEVDNISVRRRRARAHYLLGQLYDYLKDYPKSLEHYQKVLKNTDAYDFRFRTQMKIARLYVQFHEQDSDDAVEKYLTRLMKDEKNEENLDKIYYEFALLEHKNDSLQNALEFLRQSLKASTGDPVQKTLSYYKSGQIYFDHLQKYQEAQAYYDSAAQVVTTEMSEYEDIKRLAKTLGEYITYKETITYQDSMLVLAELPKEELDSIVDLVIAEEKRKEEALKAKELESQLSSSNLDNLYALNNQNGKSNKGQGGDWYFDTPATVSNGKIEFQQLWGNRKNEDNWRRKNKALSSASFADAQQEQTTAPEEVDSTLLKSVGDKYNYYKDIPKTDEDKAVASGKVEEALYMLGQIYFQKLEEPDSAISTLENLLDRFEGSEYTLRARYALYQLYSEKKSPIAEAQKNFILNEFPNSVYAYLIQGKDPNVLKEDEQDYELAYEGLYNSYQGKQFRTSVEFSEYIIEKYKAKEDFVKPEVHFIRGMSYGYLGKRDSMKAILTELVGAYPEADVTPQAKETLRLLNQGFSEANPQEVAEETKPQEDVDPNDPKYKGFSKDVKKSDRIFVLMYVSSELQKSEVQSKISDFNKAEFQGQKLRVFTFAYTKTQKLLPYISRFSSVEDAEKYIRTFKDSDVGKEILTTEEDKIFFITHTNFKTAYGKKRMEDYISFYQNIMGK